MTADHSILPTHTARILNDLEAAGFNIDRVAVAIARATGWRAKVRRLLHYDNDLGHSDFQFLYEISRRGVTDRDLARLNSCWRRAF
jgi:hypothetical protein